MRSLRTKLYLALSLPAGLALAMFYAATLVEGGDAKWLFRMGLTFTVVAYVLGRMVWLAHRNNVLEDRTDNLARRLRELENELQTVRTEVDSHLIVKAWRQAMGGTRDTIRLLRSEEN